MYMCIAHYVAKIVIEEEEEEIQNQHTTTEQYKQTQIEKEHLGAQL